MLESILYFLLGFLAAALLALMISPVIWQRAISLTKRRIERSVPLTLNEIQADKDQLRAEFAMSTRRLEMSVDELREKASTQIIEINRKRDDIARLAEEQGDKIHAIEELQTKSGELRIQLQQREEQLEKTNQRLNETRENLDQKALELEQMRQRYEKSQTNFDSSKIELVAKQTELENLTDKLDIHDLADQSASPDGASKKLKTELAKIKSRLAAETASKEELKMKLKSASKQLSADAQRLERHERELARLRDTSSNDDAANAELTSQLVNLQSMNVELEAKLAQSNLQMEALLHDASNDNVEKAMTSLEEEKTDLAQKVELLSAERDELADKLSHHNNNSSQNWETERRENSILRERINDLAAQVTAMTAALEGDNSPIHEILSRQNNVKPTRSGKKDKSTSTGQPASLADRIRALQDAAG
ncbi:MAG: hypothetical protein L3J32_07180 [Rhizobiaceae bacterium]|nr:hypothetical protein [Rhizobiaceae bacterium]